MWESSEERWYHCLMKPRDGSLNGIMNYKFQHWKYTMKASGEKIEFQNLKLHVSCLNVSNLSSKP